MIDNKDFVSFEESDDNAEQLKKDGSEEHFNEEMADEVTSDEGGATTKSKASFFGKKSTGKESHLKEEIMQLNLEKEKLDEEKRELKDQFLRLYSEFDNYKKRTQKERLELIETASEKVILDILDIIDDFERAIDANSKIESAPNDEDLFAVMEGFKIIYRKLLDVLNKNGVEEIIAKGEPFDTDFHEAIAHIQVNDEEKGKVIDVVQKGYTMKGKVIRYAKVAVGN